jgi:NAD(P)-dependent dehydrogenase (short-subunit alcohol dehydrogenase family)
MNHSEYQGSRVVVTGSSSGIGRALSDALVHRGAEVHGAALTGPGEGLASFTALDLADPSSIDAAVAGIGGHVDALFNCAGATPIADPEHVVAVNFLGTRLLTEQVLSLMSSGGAVVSVSSNGGFGWRRRQAFIREFVEVPTFADGLAWFQERREEAGHPYLFAKEALTVWTMMQSAQLIRHGLRINVVSPGAVRTPMLEAADAVTPRERSEAVLQPIGRSSSPEEQVGALLFLNSDAASYVNGVDLPVDGGYWAARSMAGDLH